MKSYDIINTAPTIIILIITLMASIEAHISRRSMIWIFTYLILGAIAIGFIFWQQRIVSDKEKTHNLKWEKMQEKIDVIFENNKSPEPSVEYNNKVINILEKLEKTIENKKPIDVKLKTRASYLSAQILKFLLDRGEPLRPKKETWLIDVDNMINFSEETMKQYSLNFGAKVIAIRNELDKKGLQDKELDAFYEHPTNRIGIRIIAERIGALAEQL